MYTAQAFSLMRPLLAAAAVVTATLPLTAHAAPVATSSGYGLLVDLSIGSIATATVGPVSPANGSAPPAYDNESSLASASADVALGSDFLGSYTLGIDTGLLVSEASGTTAGTPQAYGSATINDLGLAVNLLPGFFPAQALGALGASTIQATSLITADGGLSATGTMIIEDLNFTGLLVGGILVDLGAVATADPNTVLLDFAGLKIILNEQLTFGDGTTSLGLTTNAIHILLDEFAFGLNLLSGDIIIASATAELDLGDGGSTPVPEPAALGLLGAGLLAVGVLRRRRRIA